ncbi:MAG: universal stress protein [Nitrospirota bacterium]|nr:universal stress protein [Nitrospirota bacterium]
MKIETILCPIDFSEGSRRAIDCAKGMAADYKARLVLLYVIPHLSSLVHGFLHHDDELSKIYEGIEKEVRREMGGIMEEIGGMGAAEQKVVVGDPSTEIIRMAEECMANLIVMGTHGRSGIDHMLFGSTTEKVVRKALCPVMTVKATSTGN